MPGKVCRGPASVTSTEDYLSPILVRPVREQFEHDRVIRLLQARWRRRFQVGVNLGAEQVAPAGNGSNAMFPDIVLTGTRSHRVEGVVEVETGESVNNLEAMAQWARFAALRVPFYLYVPSGSVDSARRLCTEHGIPVAEIWSYYSFGDQIRFTLIHKAPPASLRAQSRPAGSASRRSSRTTADKASGPRSKTSGTSRKRKRPAGASSRGTEKKAGTTGTTKRLGSVKRPGTGSRVRSGKRAGTAKRSAAVKRPNAKRGRRPQPAARAQKRK